MIHSNFSCISGGVVGGGGGGVGGGGNDSFGGSGGGGVDDFGGSGGGGGDGTAAVGPAGQAYGGGDPTMTGPATNRLAAMKAAFHSQYKSQVRHIHTYKYIHIKTYIHT